MTGKRPALCEIMGCYRQGLWCDMGIGVSPFFASIKGSPHYLPYPEPTIAHDPIDVSNLFLFLREQPHMRSNHLTIVQHSPTHHHHQTLALRFPSHKMSDHRRVFLGNLSSINPKYS